MFAAAAVYHVRQKDVNKGQGGPDGGRKRVGIGETQTAFDCRNKQKYDKYIHFYLEINGRTSMSETPLDAIRRKVQEEPFARKMNIELLAIDEGYSLAAMTFTPDMENIFGMAHGGAIFALIDEAFETASNSHGVMAVALNMNVTYLAAPSPGDRLRAEAKEINRTRRTANYYITVQNQENVLLATCQALVYRKKDRLPFLEGETPT
jgi:acyl-CoA thioesterase